MPLSTTERKLIKLLAEAYAFIGDLRETGLRIGNSLIVQRTEGIDNAVKKRSNEFPRLFQRYYNDALKRADKERKETVVTGKVPSKSANVPRPRGHGVRQESDKETLRKPGIDDGKRG